MSEVKVNKISPRTGTATTIGDSGDTFTVPSGANLVVAGTLNPSGTITAGSIAQAALAADIIDGTKLADNAVDSEHYTDGSIDTAHLSADAVDGTKIADNAIDSEHYVDASIDNAHLADDAVGVAELSATGTASSSTFLRGDNAWASAGASYDIGTFTRDISTADGTQAVTGVGFQPTHIIFKGNINAVAGGFSVGFDDGTTRRTSAADGSNASTFIDGHTTYDISILCRDVAGVSGASYEGKASSFDADGFTITWNKINSPTGSLVVYYMAFKQEKL